MTEILEEYAKLPETEFWCESEDLKVGPTIEICSGGTRDRDQEPLPALFATQEAAKGHFVEWLFAFFEGKSFDWKWVEKPRMRRLQITMTDLTQQERFIQTRWVVTAKIMYANMENKNAQVSEGVEKPAAA